MMPITATTPGLLHRLRDHTRPFSFLLCPLVDATAGYPAGVDPERFTLVTRFSKHANRWWHAACVNIHDNRPWRLAPRQSRALDRVIPQTFESMLRAYLRHPESKSLGPDGQPCGPLTRGLLQRTHVVERDRHYIEKETDRSWEHGEDLGLLTARGVRLGTGNQMVAAGPRLRKQIRAVGIREMMRRTKLHQHTIERIVRGERVRARTLRRVVDRLDSESPGACEQASQTPAAY
jgi:hypothetical protein